MLDEVNAQHAFKPNWRSPIIGLGVVGLNHLAQGRLRSDGLHRLQKIVTPCGLTVMLERLVCGHGKGLLLYDPYFTHDPSDRGTCSALP